MKKTILVLAMSMFFTSCYRDVENTKLKAPAFLKERGYTITSYDGYESDIIGGGLVAYVVKDSAGFVYSLEIQEWKGELHIYNQKCLNAVSNSNR
jgi:hypothetical protein